MKCPKCESSVLQKKHFLYDKSVELDVCPDCKGMWFDRGELDQLDDSVRINVEEEEYVLVESEAVKCPSCEGELQSFSPVALRKLVVEYCRGCEGFWLDEHELDDIREMSLRLDSERSREVSEAVEPEEIGQSGLLLALINFGYSLPR